MNIDEIPTPETDAAFPLSENWHYPDSDEYLMRRKVAKKLEHERDGLQRAYAAAIRQMNEAIAKAEWLRTDAIADLERQRDEARSTAHLWQDRWMNDTPLEECGGTLMPWMVGWKDSSDNADVDTRRKVPNGATWDLCPECSKIETENLP